jgi:hypothetical protein
LLLHRPYRLRQHCAYDTTSALRRIIQLYISYFSKYAIEKLRQVFIITFTNKADLDQEEQENALNGKIRLAKLERELRQAESRP